MSVGAHSRLAEAACATESAGWLDGRGVTKYKRRRSFVSRKKGVNQALGTGWAPVTGRGCANEDGKLVFSCKEKIQCTEVSVR